jgi:hypothetical protein
LLEWFNFSRSIEFTYLMNCFKYLLVSSLLLTGQLPTLSTLVFSFSLSFFSVMHWNIRWSTVCVPCLHGQSGLPIIFNRCKYDRIFPCPVVIFVTFGLKVKFTASLLSTLGVGLVVHLWWPFHTVAYFLDNVCCLNYWWQGRRNLLPYSKFQNNVFRQHFSMSCFCVAC